MDKQCLFMICNNNNSRTIEDCEDCYHVLPHKKICSCLLLCKGKFSCIEIKKNKEKVRIIRIRKNES